ncbi:hypothetical protein HHK36_011593 [Tetracentron sinense]|uniref:Bifunctional inhibitor/plant lipid transfer protein/seed storage helical domain-containing protein n=1 Tax=Tetracentron sinense TaxID=13715 RepID=A0A835DKJ7_TETSI|nr:hypothetical protein HHK36_011593 [Tetracentron sinense]
MGTTRITVAGILIVATVFLTTFSGVSAQSPAPAPSTDCFSNLLNMSDCLTYVEAGSNLTTPEKKCCPELAGLVESNPICLCELLGNTSSLGIQISLTKALNLPNVCRISTPPLGLCAAIGIPIGAPTASESPKSPGGSPTSGPGSVPSSGSSDGASSITNSALIFLVGISTAALATFF